MISVIIPAHNEEIYIYNNVKKIVQILGGMNYEFEIILIDDCSDDDTYLISSKLLNDRVKLYRKATCQGKGSAIKTGWKMAKGEYVFIIDADLQVNPKEIKNFFKIMDFYEADVVIGNKRHQYSNVEYTMSRSIVSRVYNRIIKILFGFPLADTQCGCKLFKKAVLDDVMDRISVKKYAFDLELLIAIRDNHYQIVDAPVFVERQYNIGSVNIKNILITLKDTLIVFFRRQRGHYVKSNICNSACQLR